MNPMTRTRVLLDGVLAAIVATTVKSKAEGVLQPLAERIFPPSAPEKARRGADPSEHLDQMPPTQLLDRATAAAGANIGDDERTQGAAALHWSMGVGAGVVYAVLAQRWPRVRSGAGAPAGLVLYAATHATLLPALGLQAPLQKLPQAALIWEPGSHIAYGVALDSALRALA